MLLFLLFTVFLGTFAQKSYDGDKVLTVTCRSAEEWTKLTDILHSTLSVENVDIWREADRISNTGDIHVRADDLAVVMDALDANNFQYKVMIEDIGRIIAETQQQGRVKRQGDIVGRYARYDEILAWQDAMAAEFSSIASVFPIGNTLEGRPMRILKFGTPTPNKWKVFIEGGMHAREWAGPSTVVYVVDQILRGAASGDPELREFVEKLDFYILPSANPDGYEYTHLTDRLWRKNRSPIEGSTCMGVDLNRNWRFQWGGASSDSEPCSNLFMGAFPETEREVINMVDYITSRASAFVAYVAYHTYGQQFFTRYDYGFVYPPDHEMLLNLAQRAGAAMIPVHGMTYEVGTAPELMYAFAGGSADWMRGMANITYSYLLELRDTGEFAFVLPPEQIIPLGEEVFAGLKVLLRDFILTHADTPAPSVPPDPMS